MFIVYINTGIFTKNALQNISENPHIKKFIVTNTLPQYSHESQCKKLEVLSVGSLLSDVIECLCTLEKHYQTYRVLKKI